jgi:hypothetical protein
MTEIDNAGTEHSQKDDGTTVPHPRFPFICARRCGPFPANESLGTPALGVRWRVEFLGERPSSDWHSTVEQAFAVGMHKFFDNSVFRRALVRRVIAELVRKNDIHWALWLAEMIGRADGMVAANNQQREASQNASHAIWQQHSALLDEPLIEDLDAAGVDIPPDTLAALDRLMEEGKDWASEAFQQMLGEDGGES